MSKPKTVLRLDKIKTVEDKAKLAAFDEILNSLDETYRRLDKITSGVALDEKDTARIYLKKFGKL